MCSLQVVLDDSELSVQHFQSEIFVSEKGICSLQEGPNVSNFKTVKWQKEERFCQLFQSYCFDPDKLQKTYM